MILFASLLACAGPDPVDTGTADTGEPADTDTYDRPDCDEPEIRVSGSDPPLVGDEWTIFLWCEDTLLTGAMVVQFDPPEVAELDENIATFIESGEATLYVQVGRYSNSRAVTIGE